MKGLSKAVGMEIFCLLTRFASLLLFLCLDDPLHLDWPLNIFKLNT